jgi:hypothetical protein
MIERRLEGRFLCADLVTVDWHSSEVPDTCSGVGAVGARVVKDNFRTVEAVLEDISALGACVQVEAPIPLGAAISISAGSRRADVKEPTRFSGLVSYCVYRDYGYFVGIRFSKETRWSTGIFEPLHLISLEALRLPVKTTLD